MKKILILIVISILAVVSFGIVKYKDLLIAAATTQTVAQIEEKSEEASKELVTELGDLGIKVDEIGEMPSTDVSTNATGGSGSGSVKSSSNISSTSASNSSKTSNGTSTNQSSSSKTPDKKAITEKYYAEFVGFKNSYESQIDAMYESAIGEYTSIPEDQRTKDKMIKIGMKYFSKAEAMESAADEKCAAILGRFESELKAGGFETDIIGEVERYYEKYKNIQKQYYLTKLKGN